MKQLPQTNDDDRPAEIAARHRPDEMPPGQSSPDDDRHAIGAEMGGSAVGGLEGTNVGDGNPDNVDVDNATGDGNYERNLDSDQEDAYAGREGGAVGGTPANKRATGGRAERRPMDVPSASIESTVGRNPPRS